jgi:hypothetical protein
MRRRHPPCSLRWPPRIAPTVVPSAVFNLEDCKASDWLSRVALHMLQRLGEPLRVEDVPQLGVERERHAQQLVPLPDQPVRVGDETAADGNQSPQGERPFRHTRRESSRYAIEALTVMGTKLHGSIGASESAVMAHSWLPPQLWRCPRCCAAILTRKAGPRCPRCTFREET